MVRPAQRVGDAMAPRSSVSRAMPSDEPFATLEKPSCSAHSPRPSDLSCCSSKASICSASALADVPSLPSSFVVPTLSPSPLCSLLPSSFSRNGSLPVHRLPSFSSAPSSSSCPSSSFACHSSGAPTPVSVRERNAKQQCREAERSRPCGQIVSPKGERRSFFQRSSRWLSCMEQQTFLSKDRHSLLFLCRRPTSSTTCLQWLSSSILYSSPAKKSASHSVTSMLLLLLVAAVFRATAVLGVSSLSASPHVASLTPHVSRCPVSPPSPSSARASPCPSLPVRPLYSSFISPSLKRDCSSLSSRDSFSSPVTSHSFPAQWQVQSRHRGACAPGAASRLATYIPVRSRAALCISQRNSALYGCCGQKESCGGKTSVTASASGSGKQENKIIPRVGRSTAGPRPDWFHVPAPQASSRNAEETRFQQLQKQIRGLDLHTVCEEAKCPNIGECWNGGTATLILLGDTCTRGCRFCAIKTSQKPPPPDPEEPEKVAAAVAKWDIDYLVMTSVDRDDMADGGASHFARTVQLVKKAKPSMLVECLVSDFQGAEESVRTLAQSGLDVYAHNIETVRRLTPFVRDKRAKYDQSLQVLQLAKKLNPSLFTKSSIMVGLGETEEEVIQTFKDLRAHDVDVVTLGQYLRPTQQQLGVVEYVTPETFQKYKEIAERLGFRYVASGPLVRSSYKAGEYFMKHLIDDARKKGKVATVQDVKLEADVGNLKGRRIRLDHEDRETSPA